MRYRDLLEALERMTVAQREQYVTVELGTEKQWCRVDSLVERSAGHVFVGHGQIVLCVP